MSEMFCSNFLTGLLVRRKCGLDLQGNYKEEREGLERPSPANEAAMFY
jgi:hypothetical protein